MELTPFIKDDRLIIPPDLKNGYPERYQDRYKGCNVLLSEVESVEVTRCRVDHPILHCHVHFKATHAGEFFFITDHQANVLKGMSNQGMVAPGVIVFNNQNLRNDRKMTDEELLEAINKALTDSGSFRPLPTVELCQVSDPEKDEVRFVITARYIYSQNAEKELSDLIYNALRGSHYQFDNRSVESLAHLGGLMTMLYHSTISRSS